MSNASPSPQTVSPEAAPGALIPSLISITKCSRALLDLRLHEIGLNAGQDHLLMALEPNGDPVLVSHLADKVGVRASTVSKMLDRLEHRELVRRGNDKKDRRYTMVTLTSQGQAARKDVQELWEEVEAYIFANCSDDADDFRQNAAQLNTLLTERLRRLR
ncbi:MAG: MarR family winged helix-turn-helix transcriptional regulator [Pseudomonadota bacterium]|nr:MarR family winged helix-turn-helix transcriptional regulator [Pseudomonadota bacterium]